MFTRATQQGALTTKSLCITTFPKSYIKYYLANSPHCITRRGMMLKPASATTLLPLGFRPSAIVLKAGWTQGLVVMVKAADSAPLPERRRNLPSLNTACRFSNVFLAILKRCYRSGKESHLYHIITDNRLIRILASSFDQNTTRSSSRTFWLVGSPSNRLVFFSYHTKVFDGFQLTYFAALNFFSD